MIYFPSYLNGIFEIWYDWEKERKKTLTPAVFIIRHAYGLEGQTFYVYCYKGEATNSRVCFSFSCGVFGTFIYQYWCGEDAKRAYLQNAEKNLYKTQTKIWFMNNVGDILKSH